MKKLFFYLLFGIFTAVLCSCDSGEKPEPDTDTIESYENGVFATCEGGFGAGNSTVFFIDLARSLFAPDIYFNTNNKVLGDVLNSATFENGKVYLILNNSDKIEIVDQRTFESSGSITGLSAPTQMEISGQTGYIGQTFGYSIDVADLATNKITHSIETGVSSKRLLLEGDRLYILSESEYMGRVKDHLYIINPDNQKSDSIRIGSNPLDWAYDHKGNLYVYCQGSDGKDKAGIYTIQTQTGNVTKQTELSSGSGYFAMITYDAFHDRVLFSQADGIYSLDPGSSQISENPVIPFDEIEFLYGLDTDPKTGEIYTGDARDFTQRGVVRIYSSDGVPLALLECGIGPNHFYFQ